MTNHEDIAARLRCLVQLRRDHDNAIFSLAEVLEGHGLHSLAGAKFDLINRVVKDLNEMLDSPSDVDEAIVNDLITEWSKT